MLSDEARLQRADWRKLAIALAVAITLVAVMLAGRWLAGH